MKPSAGYDYTQEVIDGKMSDDFNYAGANPSKWAEIFARDIKAPDNAITLQDVEDLFEIRSRKPSNSSIKLATNVNEATIAKALEGSTMKTLQDAVSLPMIQRYVKMLENGEVAPPITVANGVIVEGNHRYIAGRIFGKEPDTKPGVISFSQEYRAKPIQKIEVHKTDWDPPKDK